MNKIKGTGVALITPFNEDFSIDYDSLEKLINHQIDGGVDYLAVMGTTGESVVLSKQEKKQVVNFCKKVNNARLPIVLGVGSNNTFALVEEIKSTDFDGIDVTPLGLEDVSSYPRLTAELLRRDYTDDDIRKILGSNILRAMRHVESKGLHLRAQRSPCELDIKEMDKSSD